MEKHFVDEIIEQTHPEVAEEILASPLIGYLKTKTKSSDKGSKSRGSFGNIYAIYVLVEDYIKKGFMEKDNDYQTYEGADFTPLLLRQRSLPFGEKLQNHPLNHRLNEEFEKYYGVTPIKRDTSSSKYWFNEDLLIIEGVNISPEIIKIIEAYIDLKSENFSSFFEQCELHQNTYEENPTEAINFVKDQLSPFVDARIFEIVSYCIIKYGMADQTVIFGENQDSLVKEKLVLYKTGRTNANDGGIDFILKPIGKIYQVTESLDFKKYFLDIDKLNKFPITFVIKTENTIEEINDKIIESAKSQFKDQQIIDRYLSCFEDIINIPMLYEYLDKVIKNKLLGDLMKELVIQCKVEFNIID